MIDNHDTEHYHVVDSTGGGYSMIAEAMKQRIETDSVNNR